VPWRSRLPAATRAGSRPAVRAEVEDGGGPATGARCAERLDGTVTTPESVPREVVYNPNRLSPATVAPSASSLHR
jgi:hypothetical protein